MKTRRIFLIGLIILLVVTFTSVLAEKNPPDGVNHSGKYVVFGMYNQTEANYGDNPYANDMRSIGNGYEPISWIVLEQDGDQLLLISKDPLDYLQYNTEKKEVGWKGSSVRKWLNGDFIRTAFTAEEQNAIIETEVVTGGEKIENDWVTSPKSTTKDRVFLLSYTEAKKYFPDDTITMNDYVNEKDIGLLARNETWWLRSVGKRADEACFIGHKKAESGWVTDWRCIRPAIWIDITKIDWDHTMYSEAEMAHQYASKGNFKEAFDITDTQPTYWDGKILSVDYRVQYAQQAMDEGNYSEAITRFADAKAYVESNFSTSNDSNTNEVSTLIKYFGINSSLLECKYQFAVQTKDSGDFEEAIRLFTDIGQYKDSMALLRQCFDSVHIQYSWLTRVEDVVDAGLDREYAEVHEITGNNPHFGWSLGRFMMSGYTEVKENGSVPVYMKTPGDSLVLWFVLSQDIDALNGDTSLTINRDTNSTDRQFGINRTDFGRGALLVRHTDFRNNQTPSQIYTDYLLASDDTGANTKIEIKEEGIYEVALDYEIRKDELFDKFFNYRISFRFEVRNGSGMFFLFDVETGSELQDYSRTENGFRIDLANSHSLSVSYTRYALNQEETGLDVRKTGLASDGEILDKVGYYEITVTNKETGETLTKHIFVGRAADLREYQAVDDSLSKFSGN